MKKLMICAALAAATTFAFATPSVDAAPDCPHDDDYIYYGTSADECAVIRFDCDEGYEYFSNNCGCGCRPV